MAGLILLTTVTASVACSRGRPESSGGRLQVVTTVSPITNLTQNIGGGRVDIIGLVPEGADSHTFEPAPADARVMGAADIVFLNGLHLEEPTLELARSNVEAGAPIVELGPRTIGPDDYIYDFSFPRANGDPNPHLWTNPPFAKRYAEVVMLELTKLDPDGEAYYRENFNRLAAQLGELDQAAREVTQTVPADNRKLLTYHDSFPYFAREYGWEIVGAIQPADFSEPTAREVARLIDQVESQEVPAIFGSEVFSSPVLEQIASETGAEYIDELRDDDLPGDPGDDDHSYMALMAFDFETFMGALGGDPAAFDRLDTSNVRDDQTAEYRL